MLKRVCSTFERFMCTVTFTRYTAAGIMAIGLPGGGIRVAGINGAESRRLDGRPANGTVGLAPTTNKRSIGGSGIRKILSIDAGVFVESSLPLFSPRLKRGPGSQGFLLVAGLVAFCSFHSWCPLYCPDPGAQDCSDDAGVVLIVGAQP